MSERIRSIALVTSSAASFVNFRLPLARELVKAGLRVYALAPDWDAVQRTDLIESGVEPVEISMDRTGTNLFRDGVDLLRLSMTLRRLRPDATLAYFIKPVIYGSLAARLAGVPRRFALMAGLGYVFTPDAGRESAARRALRILVSRLYQAGFAACERVFFHNSDDLEFVVAAGLVDPAKALVIAGTGVDLSRFPVSHPETDPVRFLLIGRLLKEKGIRDYAEAAALVRAAHPDVEFHLVGDLDINPGSLKREEIDAWVNGGILIWHGHVADVRPFIAQTGVYVLPSYREGKPRSTQEAMAMGRAVVTTDAPGCRDTVLEGVNGFKVPVANPAALAAAMKRFIEDRALIGSMGAQSRRLAEDWFDVRNINAVILGSMGVGPVGSAP